MTKLIDVARRAGVSQGTASNVFNRPELVRLEVRERVEDAARALNYTGPDPKGRVLRAGKFNAIGVMPTGAFGVSTAFRDPWMRQFMTGVSDVCEQHGAGLSLVSGREDQKSWGVDTALIDGFILFSTEDAALVEGVRRRKLPVVVVGEERSLAGISTIAVADREGMRSATRHLLDLGHRRFGVISVLRETRAPIFHPATGKARTLVAAYPTEHQRLAGIADALAEEGLSLDDMALVEACGSAEELTMFGVSPTALLLDNAPDITAVIALTDVLALSAIETARARGLNVPRDLSVVGFDDIPEAATVSPMLTTVGQPTLELGRMAVRMLFEGGPAQHVVVHTHLVVRGSTAPPRR